MDVPFEGLLARKDRQPTLRKRATLALSVVLHAVALVVAISYSFWHVDELSAPALAVTLRLAVPPPPPPPPPPRRSSSTRSQTQTKPEVLTRPKEPTTRPEPKAQTKEDEKDDGEAQGEAGGVQGGVVGGVVGGVLPAEQTGPKILPPQVARGLLLIDPSAEQYRVKVPRVMESVSFNFVARLRVCVSEQGSVTQVQVLKGGDPAIDPQFPTVISRWRYRPYMADGRAVPWCTLLDYKFSQR
jgi:protein TonB